MSRRNNCLNLLKAFACIGVVFTHVTFPLVAGQVIKSLSEFAVPLFFMIAGYYAYNCDRNKINKRLAKILRILIFGYFLFFLYDFLSAIRTNTLTEWLTTNFTLMTPIKYIVFCTIDWAVILWYLIAMAETYLFWSFIVKKNKQDNIIKYTYILLLCGAILTTVVESLNLPWMYKINFLFRALPWFLIGYLTKRDYEEKLKQVNNIKLILFVVLGWFITLFPILFKTKINFNYFGVLITAPSLFFIGIKNPDIKPSTFLNYLGDNLSLYVYLFHQLVGCIIIILISKLFNINVESMFYMVLHPIITLTLTIVVSFVFNEMMKVLKLNKLFK